MLYVTVCYVCCLCSEVPMRCHWCCCFRYIRISSLFFLVWFVWSERIYYSIYLEIFVGTRTSKCCVALPVLNVRFLCVRLSVSLCFSCAFHPFAFDMSNCRGKTYYMSHLLYCGFLSFGRQVSAVNLPPRPSLRVVCLVERMTMRYMVSERLSREINLLYHPTPPPFLVPQCAVSLWGFVLIRCLSEPKSQYTHNLALIALPPPLTPSSQPLRVDVAVLPTSSWGQDPTFSSVWLTSSCSIYIYNTTTHKVHLYTISTPPLPPQEDVTWWG